MFSERFKKHIWYYTSFVILQVMGLWLVLLTSFDKHLQLASIFLTTGIYILWSLIHQQIHHTLHAKIAAEYIMVGGVGLAIALLLFH